MTVVAPALRRLVAAMFAAAGCSTEEADRVAAHLVEANLVGHDSHGVIRVPSYIQWLGEGKVLANQTIDVVTESDSIAVVDGRFGLGQSIGEQAVRLGIEKAKATGLSAIALRNSGHLGRIGDWPLMAAEAGLLSLHFVNTSGAGNLVAPYGGINRRLSANPVAAGVPVPGREPLLMDISACTIAEGKIRVALNKGVTVPDNCIIDSEGNPTNEPKVFYADPPGAILPIAGHKGYALSMMAEMFAGALTGSSCTNPANSGRVVNGMFSLYLDRKAFQSDAEWDAETNRFIDFVKSSAPTTPGGEILVPGEPESRTKANRLANGIELDDTTWGQISATCANLRLNPTELLA